LTFRRFKPPATVAGDHARGQRHLQQALKAEALIRTAVFDGKYGKPSGEAIFMEYAGNVSLPWSKDNKLSYQNGYDKITRPFKEFFSKMSFKQITPMIIERYKHLRQATRTKTDEDSKPSSVNRELQLLSKIFSLAIRDGLTQAPRAGRPRNCGRTIAGLVTFRTKKRMHY
jgi:hypothetical protein